MRKKTLILSFFILFLGIVAGNLDYPQFLNLRWFPNIPFKLGLDLQGGTHLIYEADLSKIEKKHHASLMEGVRDVIERRVNLFGVREPVVQIQQKGDQYRLIVELPGVKDPAQAIKEIGKTPYLEFRELKPEQEVEKIKKKREEIKGKTQQEIKKIKDWELAFEDIFKPTPLTGKYLKKAEVGFDKTTYKPVVLLQFDKEGSKIFEQLTERNIGKPLAIYIDGVLISSPIVQEKISGGKAQITGNFTINQAKELARNLNAGALPVPIKLISQQSVGPILGEISLKESLIAGIIGFLGVILFLIVFYRLPGIIAGIALANYVAFALSLFKLIPVTLTLAGIGGFILSIGMAVDANVLIFSRMKEELKKGKNLSFAIEEGFRRAWPSIRDGNLTTLIVGLVLFSFGTSFVKGFAFTLILGILLSMVCAIFVTKTFLKCFIGTKLENIKFLWG